MRYNLFLSLTGFAKNIKISLQKMKAKIIDGDRNLSGKFSNLEEWICLLYIETPELSKSNEEKD